MDEWEAEAAPDFHDPDSQLQASGVDLKTHASSEPPHVASKQEAMAVGLRRDLAELTGTLAMNVPLLGSLFAGGSARVLHAQTTSPGPALSGGFETEPSVVDEQDSETEEVRIAVRRRRERLLYLLYVCLVRVCLYRQGVG